VNVVIRCRRVLQWTYVYAYYITADPQDRARVLFENHQQKLEEITEKLHGLSERPLDGLKRTEMISHTRLVEKFRDSVVKTIQMTYEQANQ